MSSACSENIADDEVFASFNESLERSNRAISVSTGNTNALLETKLTEQATHYKAEEWAPKAFLVTKLSADLYQQLEALKTKNNANVDSIFRSFRSFKSHLDKISPIFKELLDNYSEFPSRFAVSKESEFKELFSGEISGKDLALLTQLQNHIKTIENRLVNLCNEQVSNNSWIIDTRSPFLIQNYSVVMPGQQIELTAGIGSFSNDAMPRISIAKRKIEISENASATYKFKAPQQPGKYSTEVQIEYVGDDGKPLKATKNVEYTVAKCNL